MVNQMGPFSATPLPEAPTAQAMFYPNDPRQGLSDATQTSSNQNSNVMFLPKKSFFDYQYKDGPDYRIAFDRRSGQPIMRDVNA